MPPRKYVSVTGTRAWLPVPPPPRAPLSFAGTPSLHLEAGCAPGYTVQTSLLFLSEGWIDPLRRDVDAFLASFEDRFPHAEDQSPFELARSLWIELGWKWIHLLGCPTTGHVRGPWGNSVVRAFLERLNSSEPPLRQVAAFFALYLFLSTQPPQLQRVFAQLDAETLEFLLELPTALASAVDTPRLAIDPSLPGSSASPATNPSADLSYVLEALLDGSHFHLVPSQAYLHPRVLPHVRLARDPKRAKKLGERGVALLGVEEEVRALSEGRCRSVAGQDVEPRRKRRRLSEAEDEDEEDAEDGERDEGDGIAADGAGEVFSADSLLALGRAYATAKAHAAPSDYALALPASTAAYFANPLPPPPSADGGLPLPVSLLKHPRYALQAHVLAEAKARTQHALQDVRVDGGGDVPDTGADLLSLLGDREGEVSGGVERYVRTLEELERLR
ncbi:hypothetical protein Rhopal_004316-T1 [Rhodotorula paludigena]|uniref:Uncharacterized protein n=1 Tax=Rhodotorula paludigena TaxID=86838 RepID=A0AAV5GQK1_9BASI|nr:hypothetical protein Rhopal_004316-T1 [Rhodotorula paludigena]